MKKFLTGFLIALGMWIVLIVGCCLIVLFMNTFEKYPIVTFLSIIISFCTFAGFYWMKD